MSTNFFKVDCLMVTNEERFGICDDDNKKPAYIDTANENNWIASVTNDSSIEIRFTAIDNCIDILRPNGEMESRCDAMMTYNDSLLFVELKQKIRNWKLEGLTQIKATIERMIETNDKYYYGFKKRKAVVANSKYSNPHFEEIDTETRKMFFEQFRIRLQFESEIIIN